MITNEKHEILTILMEECAEASVEASKIIRFDAGFDKLESELGDIYCMIEILIKKGYIKKEALELCSQAKNLKLQKWSNIDMQEDVAIL
jgi:hypothetical protein|tara:strand:+ start:1372 stop:1638 length:267 start_codon:yes stop_codon:yes gene_type:complete